MGELLRDRFLFLKELHCLIGRTLSARKHLTKFVLVQVFFSTPYKDELSMLYIMGMLEGNEEAVRMRHGEGMSMCERNSSSSLYRS